MFNPTQAYSNSKLGIENIINTYRPTLAPHVNSFYNKTKEFLNNNEQRIISGTVSLAMLATLGYGALACSGNIGDSKVYPTQKIDNVLIKNEDTDLKGSTTFKDNTTEETVTVRVFDILSNPLGNMNVQFWDSTAFEGFLVEDSTNNYLSSFRLYPHNSMHSITMYTSGPKIREVNNSSLEGQAIDNLVEHAKDNWVYLGRRTPEQLDAENEIYLFILNLVGINLSVISDVAGKISDISDSISSWHEPEFYDVYCVIPKNPITTSVRVLVPVESESESELVAPSDESVLEKLIRYVWDLESNNVQYYFDGDRNIKVRVTYTTKDWPDLVHGTSIKYQDYFETHIDFHVLTETIAVSSKELKSNPVIIITELESRLLDSLKKFGALNVDIVSFQEGNKAYKN